METECENRSGVVLETISAQSKTIDMQYLSSAFWMTFLVPSLLLWML